MSLDREALAAALLDALGGPFIQRGRDVQPDRALALADAIVPLVVAYGDERYADGVHSGKSDGWAAANAQNNASLPSIRAAAKAEALANAIAAVEAELARGPNEAVFKTHALAALRRLGDGE